MTNRDRENATLSFAKFDGRGSVEETFYPWTQTLERFAKEGIPESITNRMLSIAGDSNIINNDIADNDKIDNDLETYLGVAWGENIINYEKYLGFDPVRRISFNLPFRWTSEEIIEETPEYIIKRERTGRQTKTYKDSGLVVDCRHLVTCEEDWERLKEHADRVLNEYYADKNIEKAYGHLKEGHKRGDYSVRINIEGFFWASRELMGIEPQMFAFYDCPEMLHDINEYILKVYLDKFTKVLKIIQADVVYIMEDLSGKNGSMISPRIFDEFVGGYYKRLIPVLKSLGVRHVFVDTDGDFRELIPNFIAAGVEGFLPMDVNAGMDIVAVRKEFPKLKFIGAFNKLCITKGKEEIDKEFERLLPVIRQGGYIPGADHQVSPSTSLEDYRYYISRLKEVMKESGKDL